MSGQSMDYNSMDSNHAVTQALMDNQHHQGRLGTPDANNASYMSSDYNNNNNQQQQHEHPMKASSSSPAALLSGISAQDLFAQLHEALALEPKYQPSLFLPQQSNVSFKYNGFTCHGTS